MCERGHLSVGDTARHNVLKPAQVRAAVEAESVEGDTMSDLDTCIYHSFS